MQTPDHENSPTQRSFTDCLQQLRDAQDGNVVTAIPNLKEWMQYWNDDESYAVNIRNIRHWMERINHRV